MSEFDILLRSIKDFFTGSILKFALVPLIITLIILYAMFFGLANLGFETLKTIAETSQNGGEVVFDENAPFYFVWLTYLIVFLFKYSFVSTIAGFLVYIVGGIFVMNFGIILTLLIIGFLTPNIVNILHKKYYKDIELKPFGTISNAITNAIKSILVMLFLYILFIPLYFVPLINILAFYLPLYYFFHKLLNFDVASTILSKNEYEEIYKKNSLSFRLRTLFLYFLSMIPFLALFIAVFYVVYLSHAYFSKLEILYKDIKMIENKA